MSHIGKQPIHIESGVDLTLQDGEIVVKGPRGSLSWNLPNGIGLEVSDSTAVVKMENTRPEFKKFYGLTRSLVANMVTGVTKGFDKKLELSGVGYRAKVEGRNLVLSVGYSHPVKITPPEGITVSVEGNVVTVSGIDKQIVGDTASKIRAVRPPEPYKGKGIKYVGEKIRRKAGKAAKASA